MTDSITMLSGIRPQKSADVKSDLVTFTLRLDPYSHIAQCLVWGLNMPRPAPPLSRPAPLRVPRGGETGSSPKQREPLP